MGSVFWCNNNIIHLNLKTISVSVSVSDKNANVGVGLLFGAISYFVVFVTLPTKYPSRFNSFAKY
jgi:hypothetical protein